MTIFNNQDTFVIVLSCVCCEMNMNFLSVPWTIKCFEIQYTWVIAACHSTALDSWISYNMSNILKTCIFLKIIHTKHIYIAAVILYIFITFIITLLIDRPAKLAVTMITTHPLSSKVKLCRILFNNLGIKNNNKSDLNSWWPENCSSQGSYM